MSIFMLETDAVTSASSSISSLISQVQAVASNVNSYDTSCEDGFDFASAKNVIAQNIDACGIKVQNTATVLDTVVNSHTQLQNNMKFSLGDSTSKATSGSTNSTNSSSSGGSYSTSAVGMAAGTIPVVAQTSVTEKKEEKNRIGIVNAKLKSTGYAVVDKEVDAESKKLFADSEFKYKDGYQELEVAGGTNIHKLAALNNSTIKSAKEMFSVGWNIRYSLNLMIALLKNDALSVVFLSKCSNKS